MAYKSIGEFAVQQQNKHFNVINNCKKRKFAMTCCAMWLWYLPFKDLSMLSVITYKTGKHYAITIY